MRVYLDIGYSQRFQKRWPGKMQDSFVMRLFFPFIDNALQRIQAVHLLLLTFREKITNRRLEKVEQANPIDFVRFVLSHGRHPRDGFPEAPPENFRMLLSQKF